MSLGDFLLHVLLFNSLALGNGPVMIPLLRKSFVEERGVLTLDQLLFAFAVAQVTPGQANLYVASVGYLLFGTGAAVLAVLVINLPGYLMLALVRGYERFRHVNVVRRFISGLTAASVGLIFATTVDMGRQSLTRPVAWGVFLLTLVLANWSRWNFGRKIVRAPKPENA